MHIGTFSTVALLAVGILIAVSLPMDKKHREISGALKVLAAIVLVVFVFLLVPYSIAGSEDYSVPVAGDAGPATTRTYNLASTDGYYLIQDTESLSFIFIAEDSTLQRAEASLSKDDISVSYTEGASSVTVTTEPGYVMKEVLFLHGDKKVVERKSYHFEIPEGSIKLNYVAN